MPHTLIPFIKDFVKWSNGIAVITYSKYVWWAERKGLKPKPHYLFHPELREILRRCNLPYRTERRRRNNRLKYIVYVSKEAKERIRSMEDDSSLLLVRATTRILHTLARLGRATVSQLVDLTGINYLKLRMHLESLLRYGFVEKKAIERIVYYSPTTKGLEHVRSFIDEKVRMPEMR